MKNNSLMTALVILGMTLLTACSGSQKVAASLPEVIRDVQVVTIQEQTAPDIFTAVGTVRALRSAPLAAQVMGNITAVNVREGDTVRPGQVLVAIDDMQPKANVDQAQAALSAAEHEVAAAESDLALAQSTFKRMQTLYDKKSLSAQEYDEVRSRLQSAQARRDTAVAGKARAAAALENARTVLDFTRVKAPFAGIVTDRRVDPGALAAPGLPLLAVEGGGQFRLEASVDERDLKYVHLGEKIGVTLDAFDGQPLSGRVAELVPAGDPASRTFTVKVDLPADKRIRSGMFGRAAFARGERKVVLLPASAITDRGQLQSVYVVGENKIAASRYVTLGAPQANSREVLSGVSAGEVVISNPGGRDLAGKKIEVR